MNVSANKHESICILSNFRVILKSCFSYATDSFNSYEYLSVLTNRNQLTLIVIATDQRKEIMSCRRQSIIWDKYDLLTVGLYSQCVERSVALAEIQLPY